MSLAITTLPTEAAVAKTFTLTGRDMKTAQWYNATDSSNLLQETLRVSQSIIGKTKPSAGLPCPIRRSLLSFKHVGIETDGGNVEEITVNITITGPTIRSVVSETDAKNLVAYARSFLTAGVVVQLMNGEV
jgi:hypothetical protein